MDCDFLCTFTIFKTLEHTWGRRDPILSSSCPGCGFTICWTFCMDDVLPCGYSLKAIYLSQIRGSWSCQGGWSRSQWPPAAAAWVMDITEYTQSGNARFLAYIPSWWTNQPWLVRAGGTRPHPFTLFTIMYKVAVYAPPERADTLPVFHHYPNVLCVWQIQCNPLAEDDISVKFCIYSTFFFLD